MTWRVGAAFAALCVIWGLPYFLIKVALTEVPPIGVAWGRIALGAAFLLPIAWKRGSLRQIGAHKGAVCAFAFCELIGPFVLIALGESWVSSSLAGILIATVPLMMIVIAPLFGVHESLGARRLAGVVIGLVGVVTLLGLDAVNGVLGWIGVGCIVIATAGYACGALIIQRYLHGVDEMGAVATSLGIATVVLLPGAIIWLPTHVPSPLVLTSIAVLGIVCSALALSLAFYIIRHIGAARMAVVTYVNPAVAVFLGIVVLHEPFGKGTVLGLALILLGSWLATHSGKPKESSVKEAVTGAP
jgi:drug/metabolite transporter (DMT)-like permease